MNQPRPHPSKPNPTQPKPANSAIAKLLSDVATSYVLQNARRPAEQQLPPIAFMVVDVDMAPRTFHEIFQYETVPHVLFFPVRGVCFFCVALVGGLVGRGSQARGRSGIHHTVDRPTWFRNATQHTQYIFLHPTHQANKAVTLPPPEEDGVHVDFENGAEDLLSYLEERMDLELEMVPDVGMTIQVGAALAAVVALAVYLGASMSV